MMEKIYKAAAGIANILTILIACFLVWIIWQRVVHKNGDPASLVSTPADKLRPGTQIGKTDLLAKDRPTLLVALAEGCHYCAESAPFYKRLSDADVPAKVVAIFPGQSPGVSGYVEHLGLKTDDIATVDFSKLGVAGTPTLILVSPAGSIMNAWVGKLTPEYEEDVFKQLKSSKSSLAGSADAAAYTPADLPVQKNSFTYDQLKEMARNHASFTLLDVRERSEYQSSHRLNAINIPMDELEVRAPHELCKATQLVLDCSYCSLCELKQRKQGLSSLCTMSSQMLRFLGYDHIAFAYDPAEAQRNSELALGRDVRP